MAAGRRRAPPSAGSYPALTAERDGGRPGVWSRGLRASAPYAVYRGAAALTRALPTTAAEVMAAAGGAAFAWSAKGRRHMVARHLRRVHGPGLGGAALDREVRRVFTSYARYWAESFRLPRLRPDDLDASLSYEGVGHVDEAIAAGRGVIMALPHLGNWDFGGAWFASVGRYGITVVVEPLQPPELLDWFVGLRRSFGLEIVPLGPDVTTVVLRRLREGGVVGLVCDRDILGTGVEVEFFGERTTLPSGPATLALRTGAALLPTAVYFRGRREHYGVVRPPVPVERSGPFRRDIARVTQLLARELEVLIRRAPDQWHLLQPNWPSDAPAAGAR